MKFLLSVAAVIAVAVAVPTQRLVAVAPAGPTFAPEPIAVGPAIIDSFEPIVVGPAVINPIEGIAVGPAMVEGFEPISVGPAIVDFPLPEDSAIAEEPAIVPSPVSVIEGSPSEVASGNPLVQIIVNINQAASSSPIAVSPVDIAAPEVIPTPVHVVESAPEVVPTPVQVVEVAPESVDEVVPTPVQVVEVAPEPVHVVEVAPVPVEPIQIGEPIIPEAAVILPEELN